MAFVEPRTSPSGVFDNVAKSYKHIEVRPLSAAMGAEVIAGDVAGLSDQAFDELKDALFRHRMIYLRNQRLDHAAHAALTLRFGPFGGDAFAKEEDHQSHVLPVIKEADVRTPLIFGGGWHTDSPFLPQPPAITILRSVVTPPLGGDTVFADTALAYRGLSPKMREMIQSLRVHMSVAMGAQLRARLNKDLRGVADSLSEQAAAGVFHPLVRTHPVTGEKALYVDQGFTMGIEGLTPHESAPILEFLVAHITQHSFTCRLKWEPDMVALWDNRLCQHMAFNDYDGHRREMYRSVVLGEVPV